MTSQLVELMLLAAGFAWQEITAINTCESSTGSAIMVGGSFTRDCQKFTHLVIEHSLGVVTVGGVKVSHE